MQNISVAAEDKDNAVNDNAVNDCAFRAVNNHAVSNGVINSRIGNEGALNNSVSNESAIVYTYGGNRTYPHHDSKNTTLIFTTPWDFMVLYKCYLMVFIIK